MRCRWVGIDCGFSQMSVALLDPMDYVLAVECTREPRGDGHTPDVALARLRVLLSRLGGLREVPVRLSGYCYEHTGVREAFVEAGWSVVGSKALNDVVGIYGLTDMVGHVVVGGCGSWPQVVYVDSLNAVTWPGDDVAAEMPEWLLCGWAYAKFLVTLSNQNDNARWAWLREAIREKLGGHTLLRSDPRWGDIGPLMKPLLHSPEARRFFGQAADAVVRTRDVFGRNTQDLEPPRVIVGGGAVRDEELWEILETGLRARGVCADRIVGEHAVGLARFAKYNPHADAWAFIGEKRPSWLS